MGKVFSTPEYVEKMVKDLLDNPEIRAILKGSENQIKLHKSKPTEQKLDDETAFHEMWLEDQLERYPKALKAVEPYLKAEGMILPIETWDFMRWFIKHAKNTDDYLAVKIEDYHFELYHEERLRVMNPPMPWEGLYNELSDAGYIKTNLEVFNHVMEYKQLPGAKDKIQWLTSKADALDVRTQFNFSMPKFNQCFRSKNGKLFTWNVQVDYNPSRNKVLSKIIEEYRPKPQQ